MNAQSSRHNNETYLDSQDLVFRRISRALDYSEGFWLGFAKCNRHPQRQAAVNSCRELLDSLNVRIVEVPLEGPVETLLPIIKDRLAIEQMKYRQALEAGTLQSEDALPASDDMKWAVFVYGVEHSIKSADYDAPLLSYLNLNREQFRKELPYSLLIWVPEYALIAISRRAPDFWAWRSGFYELRSDMSGRELLHPPHWIPNNLSSRLSAPARRETLALLKGLQADYAEFERGPHELKVEHRILIKIGLLHQELCEYLEAEQAFKSSLAIAQQLGNGRLVVTARNRIGRLSQIKGDYSEAWREFSENLRFARELNHDADIAFALLGLGRLEQEFGDLQRGTELLKEGLNIRRQMGDALGASLFLIQLGRIQQKERHYAEAQRLYKESLKICRDNGIPSGISTALASLGIVKKEIGELYEAEKFLESSLRIRREIGDRFGEAFVLGWLGSIKHELGYYQDARKKLGMSLKIKQELGDLKGEAYVLQRLGNIYRDEGLGSKASEYQTKAKEILAQLGLSRN